MAGHKYRLFNVLPFKETTTTQMFANYRFASPEACREHILTMQLPTTGRFQCKLFVPGDKPYCSYIFNSVDHLTEQLPKIQLPPSSFEMRIAVPLSVKPTEPSPLAKSSPNPEKAKPSIVSKLQKQIKKPAPSVIRKPAPSSVAPAPKPIPKPTGTSLNLASKPPGSLDIYLDDKYRGAVVKRPANGFTLKFFQPGDRVIVDREGELLPGVICKLRRKYLSVKLAMYEDTTTVLLTPPSTMEAAVRLSRQTPEDQKLSLYYVELEKQRVKRKGERNKQKRRLHPSDTPVVKKPQIIAMDRSEAMFEDIEFGIFYGKPTATIIGTNAQEVERILGFGPDEDTCEDEDKLWCFEVDGVPASIVLTRHGKWVANDPYRALSALFTTRPM